MLEVAGGRDVDGGRRLGWAHRIGALALVAGLLGLQLRAMLGPYEDWPFTSAPMFARYHAPGDPLFELTVIAAEPGGAPFELLPKDHLGIGELAFRRQLFQRHYGSVDPAHPGGHHANDDPVAFQRRMAEWFDKVARSYRSKNHRELATVGLELRQVGSGSDARRLLDYDVSMRRLTRHAPAP